MNNLQQLSNTSGGRKSRKRYQHKRKSRRNKLGGKDPYAKEPRYIKHPSPTRRHRRILPTRERDSTPPFQRRRTPTHQRGRTQPSPRNNLLDRGPPRITRQNATRGNE